MILKKRCTYICSSILWYIIS